MWQDMGLYWAWRGADAPLTEPPSRKEILYVAVPGGQIAWAVIEKTEHKTQVRLVNEAEISQRFGA